MEYYYFSEKNKVKICENNNKLNKIIFRYKMDQDKSNKLYNELLDSYLNLKFNFDRLQALSSNNLSIDFENNVLKINFKQIILNLNLNKTQNNKECYICYSNKNVSILSCFHEICISCALKCVEINNNLICGICRKFNENLIIDI